MDRRERKKRKQPKRRNRRSVRYYAVTLIDVLGQQEALREWSRLSLREGLPDGLVTRVDSSAGVVLSLRRDFQSYYRSFDNRPASSSGLQGLTSQQKEILRAIHLGPKLSTQQFSDTMVFYAPVVDEMGNISSIPLYKMLGAAAIGLLRAMVTGHPIRGAITVGTGIELGRRDFYGPALAQAHYLESTSAEYPRVVVSDQAIDFLKTSPRSGDPNIAQLMAQHQEFVQQFITKDDDGLWIVDYLGQSFANAFRNVPEFENTVKDAYLFAVREAERFRQADNLRLAERYDRLVEYFRRGLPQLAEIPDTPSSR